MCSISDWGTDNTNYLLFELRKLYENGDLEQSRLLLEGGWGGRRPSPELIHAVFCKVCEGTWDAQKVLELAKWLVETHPDIDVSADNEKAFRSAFATSPDIDLVKWLLEIKPNIDVSTENEYAFYRACVYGRIDITEWLMQLKPDIDLSVKAYLPFRAACHQGKLEMAMWLFKLNSDINDNDDDIDIDIYEDAFVGTCHGGYLEVSKWLLKIKPEIDVSWDDEHAFIGACKCGHMKTVRWLLEVNPDIDITANEHCAFIDSCKWDRFDVAKFLKDLRPDVYNLDSLDDLFVHEPHLAKMMRQVFTRQPCLEEGQCALAGVVMNQHDLESILTCEEDEEEDDS
jgi:hypothetical protein